ncbi:unnamed protein product [Tenebrio molitor]|nr:unnamed protein product [Tenebrio molitor]
MNSYFLLRTRKRSFYFCRHPRVANFWNLRRFMHL